MEEHPKWPKLRHKNPIDMTEHLIALGKDFNAVYDYVGADVSDRAPKLPGGIERKIRKGIKTGLAQVEGLDHSTTGLPAQDLRSAISSAILKEITAETAAVFHNRVPFYLFNILHNSYRDVCLKYITHQNANAQQEGKIAGTASASEIVPHTPPKSPQEETNFDVEDNWGSDTEGIALFELDKDTQRWTHRVAELQEQLQEVERERRAGNQKLKANASKIKNEILEVELKRTALFDRYADIIKAMKKTRLEQDRTGDYGTEAMGYDYWIPYDMFSCQNEVNARSATLKIERQAVVNRLFNMDELELTRKVVAAALQDNERVGVMGFRSITKFSGAKLSDDGNIRLWVNSYHGYDGAQSAGDAFAALQDRPSWDQAIFGGFASHLTEQYEIYEVEAKDFTADMIDLKDRKHKAAVITNLVNENLTLISSMHIDIIKDICFSRRTMNNESRVLVLQFSDLVTANKVLDHGLQLEGRHSSCEVFDVNFFDRCGYCQAYGSRGDACYNMPRCGICAGRHRRKFCKSAFSRCALCDGPYRSDHRRCPVKIARKLAKVNARFPTKKDPPHSRPSPEPDEQNPPMSSKTTGLPDPSGQQVGTIQAGQSNPGPTPVHTAPPGALTPYILQPGNDVPAVEAALSSDISRKRGLSAASITAVVGSDEPRPLSKKQKT